MLAARTKYRTIEDEVEERKASSDENFHFGEQASQHWIRPFFWFAAVVLGAVQPWEGWYTVAEDGVSYLEIGQAFARGDWANAINAYWSPFYPLILGIILRAGRFSLYWESTVVHCVNFLIYLCALGAFDFFLCQFIRFQRKRSRADVQQGLITFSASAWTMLAYGLFIWSSLEWISIRYELADMLLSVFVYLTAGLVLRISLGARGRWTFILFGALLGLGYLTKSAMFPLAFIFIGVVWFLIRESPKAVLQITLAFAAFLCVASPYIVAVSVTKDRLTFGDSGKLNYIWFANGEQTTQPHNWSRIFPDDGRPIHPTRQVMESPALYTFDTTFGGTYPPWYDPSYWHEGIAPKFELAGQLRVLKRSVRKLFWIFIGDAPFILSAFLVCWYVAGNRWRTIQGIAEHWALLVPSLAAIGMYSIVYLSARYIAPFVVILWMSMFAGMRLPNSSEYRRLMLAIPASILMMMAVHFSPPAFAAVLGETFLHDHWVWKVAERLHEVGVQPGDKVAHIGYGASAYWAHLAQVRIVAELFAEQEGFSSVENIRTILADEGSLKPEVIQAFASTGAKAIVAKAVPPAVSKNGWVKLGSDYYVYILPP
jgi:hypothetical protein